MNGSLRLRLLQWYKDPPSFFRDLYSLEPFYYQGRIMKEVSKLRRMMLLAAGGTGKTIVLAALGLWLCIVYSNYHKKKYDVIIVAGSDEQARSLYQYSTEPLQNHAILSQFVDGDVLKTLTRLKPYGSLFRALPNSEKAIQGKHAPGFIIDEAVLAGNFRVKDAYRVIGQFEDSKLILSGTPMEYDTLFVDMWLDEKKYPDYYKIDNPTPRNWARFSWNAMECPVITEEDIEEARRELSEDEFSIFWLGKPYPLINTVIPVSIIRKQSIGYEKFKYDYKNKLGKIVFGVDWGFAAYSVLIIAQYLENKYKILDALEWKQQQYDNVHEWIASYADMYKPDRIFVDINPRGESLRCVANLQPKGHYVKPINMSQERHSLQVRMKSLFEHGRVIIPESYQPLLNELKRYKWDQTKNDDRVTGLMLSLKDLEEHTYSELYYKIAKPRRRAMRF